MQRLLKALMCLAFAAGKLPQAREVSARRALGDEESPVAEDETGGDFYAWAGHVR